MSTNLCIIFIDCYSPLLLSRATMDPKSFYSSRLRRKHAQLRYIPEDSDDSELSSDEAENVDSFQADSMQ